MFAGCQYNLPFGSVWLQVQLYEDFSKSRAKKEVNKTVDNVSGIAEDAGVKKQNSSHIFQVSLLSC